MFVDIMFENHAWHRYWDGFHVSHNEPAITWCNVLQDNYSHDIEKIFNFSTITLQYPNFFGYLFYCHYFVYSNSTIIIKLTKPKTSYSLISKLSEVFEVTFFRISSKYYVGTGYIFLV